MHRPQRHNHINSPTLSHDSSRPYADISLVAVQDWIVNEINWLLQARLFLRRDGSN